jgi:hypothetical protein
VERLLLTAKFIFFLKKEITILFGATGFKIKKNRQKLTSFSLNCDFLALFLVISLMTSNNLESFY